MIKQLQGVFHYLVQPNTLEREGIQINLRLELTDPYCHSVPQTSSIEANYYFFGNTCMHIYTLLIYPVLCPKWI